MRRKNLWLRVSSCTMAALLATTSVAPVSAADFTSEIVMEDQQEETEAPVIEEETQEDVSAEVTEDSAEADFEEDTDLFSDSYEAEEFADNAEALSDGAEETAQSGFGSKNTELTKGSYKVTVSLKKTNMTDDSMAASCIADKGTLKVAEDGSAKLTVPLTSVTMGSVTAWASEWKVYKSYESETDKGLTDAEYTTDEEGHVNSITFDIPDKTQDGVFVNMKSGGPQANDAYIAIDYATAEKVEEGTETVDTSALEATIAKAESLEENSYTKATWDANKDAIAEALTAAKAALEAKESQETVDAANTALTDAMGKLEEAGDPTELQKAIDDAKALKEEDYTYKSVNNWWESVQTAISNASTAIENRESQNVLDSNLRSINEQVAKLVKAYDQTELKKVVAAAEALKEEDYTAESWKEADLKAEIKAAQNVITTRGGKEDVKGAINSIENAIEKLEAVSVTVTVGRGDFEQKLTPGTYSLPIDLLNAGHITSTKEFTSLDYMSHTSMAAGCFPEAATLVIHEDGTATITAPLTYIHYTGQDGAADDWSIYENTQDFLDGKANSSTGARFNARIDKKGILAGKTKPKQISFTVPDLKQNVVATRMHIEIMNCYQDACIGLDWKYVKKISDETTPTSNVEKTYVVAPDMETQLKGLKDGNSVKLEEDVVLTDDLTVKGGTIDLNGHTLDQSDNLLRIKGNVTIIDSSEQKSGKITSKAYLENGHTTSSVSVEKGSLTATGITIDGQVGNGIANADSNYLTNIGNIAVNLKDCVLVNSSGQYVMLYNGITNGLNLTMENCAVSTNVQITAVENTKISIKKCELNDGAYITGSSVVIEDTTVKNRTAHIEADDSMTLTNDSFDGLTVGGSGDALLENVTCIYKNRRGGALEIEGTGLVTVRGGVYDNQDRQSYAIDAGGVAPLIESGYFYGTKAVINGGYSTPEGKVLGKVEEGTYKDYWTVVDGTTEEVADPAVTIFNADGTIAKKFSEENAANILKYVKDGQTVKLDKDITEELETVYRNCTVDLNGHVLTLSSGFVGKRGTCRIIDSSADKSGKYVSEVDAFTAIELASATLILDGITCEATNVQQFSMGKVFVINNSKISGISSIHPSTGGGSTYVQDSTWIFPEGTDGRALLTEIVRSAQYAVTETGERTFTVTATDLGKAMRAFETVDASAYTKTSYAAAKKLYDEINTTVDDELTADVIAQKAKELNDAVAALVKPASESAVKALSDAVVAAKKLSSADYTAASYKVLTNAVSTAEKALKAEEPSADAVAAATKTLADARAKLVKLAGQSITGVAGTYSKKYGDKAFTLKAKAKTSVSYKSDNTKVAVVDRNGKVTIKGAGTARITITAAGTSKYKKVTRTVTIKIARLNPTIKTKVSTRNIKYTTLKKKAQVFTLGTTVNSKGKLTYKKLTKSSVIGVSSSGRITVKKGAKKGTYRVKIRISAAARGNFNAGSRTVTVTVKVK